MVEIPQRAEWEFEIHLMLNSVVCEKIAIKMFKKTC